MPGARPYARALAITALWRGTIETFDTLDVGGGFPVRAVGEPSPDAGAVRPRAAGAPGAIPADRQPTRLAIEPGRALVARAGWLVARVLHVRDRAGRQVVLDAGMTELIRPALYGARCIRSGRSSTAAGADGPARRRGVEGPICESTDTLGTHELPPLRRGDLVAIADAGAYAASLRRRTTAARARRRSCSRRTGRSAWVVGAAR